MTGAGPKISARELARALNGRAYGNSVYAPGPGHSEHDNSLKVTLDEKAPGGMLIHSHACDDWRLCRDYVQARLGLPAWQPGDGCDVRVKSRPGLPSFEPSPRRQATDPEQARGKAESERRDAEDKERDRRRALGIWAEAVKPAGTIVERYLANRGTYRTDDVLAGDSIRFHPRCPFGAERFPTMLGLMRNIITNEPQAIHRTALKADGFGKGDMPDGRSPKQMWGPVKGAVIKLWPDEEVTLGLVLGEGVETTLAAATRIVHRHTLLQPAWAAGSKGTMRTFPVLPGVEALTLLVDKDESGTGEAAADECARRWKAAGREVTRLVPRELGTDFADIVAEVSR